MAKDHKLLRTIDEVGRALNEAWPYGLQAEVMATAIESIRENPQLDISVAISEALTEWDLQ